MKDVMRDDELTASLRTIEDLASSGLFAEAIRSRLLRAIGQRYLD